MTRDQLNAWVLARKAEGLWVQQCAAQCGAWFTQAHKGRRAIYCRKHRCDLWRSYRAHTGRAPPEWLLAKWRELHGNAPRWCKAKRHEELQAMEDAA